MSIEVRKVSVNWEHPKDGEGNFIPLYGGSFSKDASEWDEKATQWGKGFHKSFVVDDKWEPKTVEMTGTFADWSGGRPNKNDYMPQWLDIERTHYQMYELVTEGTPISPVMETPEVLARWLADNKASAGLYATATYDQWLAMIKAGSPVGGLLVNCATGEVMSGFGKISIPKSDQ